ncbi:MULTISPECIES: hypothetical protein [unclassified Streptomyces]|uniref:hypothetical protein n=1 Tax=unclassified Streptomyces TaxID=2593676 RepID=UPI0004C1636D|nr:MULTISPECIES: hypothetical protein [unclassified Streptomyces]
MADDERERDEVHHPQAPWWWGTGPVGAAVLVAVGVGWLLWLYVWPSGGSDNPAAGYGAGKAVCIGLVLLGGAVLERFRGRATRERAADERGAGERKAGERGKA